MKKIFYALIASLCMTTCLFSQPAIQWQKSLGGTNNEFCWSVVQTRDNGFVLPARSRSNDGDVTNNHGNNDYWIVKTDSAGNLQWEKSLGGSRVDAANSIIQTSDEGYLISGFSSSIDGDINDHHGPDTIPDIWIVKIDSIGTIQWSKSYGGIKTDIGTSIDYLDDGGFLICGHTNSTDGDVSGLHIGTNPDDYDIWLFKIDSIGNMLWQKCLGGTREERYAGAFQTQDNGFIVYGDVFGSSDGDVTGNTDTAANAGSAWVIKLDSSLNIQWQRTYGGLNNDQAKAMIELPGGGYVLGCITESNDGDVSGNHASGENDYWLVRLDVSGNILWQKCYGGMYADNLFDLIRDYDGGYIMTGSTISNDGDVTPGYGQMEIWIVKTDSTGNILWQKCYGGSLSEFSGEIKLTSDSGYVLSGYSLSNDGDVSGHHGPLTLNDVWLVKFSRFLVGLEELDNPISDLIIFPNPSNSYLNISFLLKDANSISVSIADLTGRVISDLAEEKLNSGNYNFEWNLNVGSPHVEPGIYLVNVTTGNFSITKKLLLLN